MAFDKHMYIPVGMTLVVWLMAAGAWTSAGGEPTTSSESPPESSASVETLPSHWSSSEKWAWTQIASGLPANFDTQFGTAGSADQKAKDRFTDPRRRLSASFLRTILADGKFSRQIPAEGVRIEGAVFDTAIDLRDAVLAHPLQISYSLFLGEVMLNRLRTSTAVTFVGSQFGQTIWLDSVRIGGSLGMHNAKFARIEMKTSVIEGDLSMSRSRVRGNLNLNGSKVHGTLFFKGTEFNGVDLTNATIGRQLNAKSSTFADTFKAGGLSTGGHVLLNERASFADVVLRSARIGGQLNLSGSMFAGRFDGQSVAVGQDLQILNAQFKHYAEFSLSKIEGGLDVGGSTFTGLNLMGTTIGKNLWVGGGNNTVLWTETVDNKGRRQNPILILLNASVGGLIDNEDSWPDILQFVLRDFTYERLTPLDGQRAGLGALRDAHWYVDWLSRDKTESMQPYRQLAGVLGSYGADATARKVLIAGRERQRLALSWWSPERWFLWLLRWSIGYGYGTGELNALYNAVPLLGIGTVVARRQNATWSDGEGPGFWYSLDMLLPGLQLSASHAQLELSGWSRYYFHVHRLTGYTLSIFVVAGLTGLTGSAAP